MEATGRQHLGNHIWETTPRRHLEDNCETTSGREVEDNKTTTGLGENIWETTSGEHMWERGGTQLDARRNLGGNWETNLGNHILETSGRQPGHNWETSQKQYL